MKILVTGGAGFIGSTLIRHIIERTDHSILNVDKLTYAGNLDSLKSVERSDRYSFLQADVCDGPLISRAMTDFAPEAIMHLAAETHVDRSIETPAPFVSTNILGTFTLLEAARRYWEGLTSEKKRTFRFHHVSSDEVYGALGPDGRFDESSAYNPRSPYAATKASSDHLVRAWFHTYGIPVLVTNSSNNYGPYQFPEKLIPLTITNALEEKDLPVYGDGKNVRDWLFVGDHAAALLAVVERGVQGETYNIGGHAEVSNIEVVRKVCVILDDLAPAGRPHERLIRFVADRPGHDFRYAMADEKISRDLGWKPAVSFDDGLRRTAQWYAENRGWSERVRRKV